MRRLLIRWSALALLLVIVGAAPAAWGHGDLEEGSPGPGDALAPGGEVLSLTFESVDPDGPHFLALLDAGGEPIAVGEAVAADGKTVCAASAPLTEGVHTLEYDVAGTDGHSVPGSYTFEVLTDGEVLDSSRCSGLDLAAPGEPQTLAEMRTGSVRPTLVYGLLAVVTLTAGLAGWRLWSERRR